MTTRPDKERQPAPDLVQRRFEATGINQLWVADMTYIPTWAGFGYLAVVLAVFSRKIVGWAFGQRQTADLVLAALNMALLTRKPHGVIHHSTPTRAASTRAWSSAGAVPRWAFAPRWAASATPTTTP